MGINLTAVVAYAITLSFLRKFDVAILWSVVISIGVLAAVIAGLERIIIGKRLNDSAGLKFSGLNKLNFRRISLKLLGFYATLLLVAAFYLLFPVYHTTGFTQYFRFTGYLLPVLLIGGIFYFVAMDLFMKEPKDSYWHAGMLVLGKYRETDPSQLKNHFLGWLVKAFFLPLMLGFLMNDTAISFQHSFRESLDSFPEFYRYAINFIFSVDLLFISAGYLLTLKIFDSHIRTAEPTVMGWLVALLCYPPLSHMVGNNYLLYGGDWRWLKLFEGNQGHLYHIYGLVILGLFAFYALASVAFGLRFSNLTNRGIITNGPYRYMKHPAYLAKNMAWWFASIPFLFQDSWQIRIQMSLLLLGLNFIYYIRAITEERHLSLDATYVKYATAMNEKGIFKGLYRRFPFLKYDVKRYVDADGNLKKLWF